MAANNIRVLVIDDSRLIREMICDYIKEAPGIEVAGTARDGVEGLKQANKLQPDVVTLDIEMPRMNGLETLDAILKSTPLPVIMCSSLTQQGADVTLDALERGALDYVAKPQSVHQADATLRDELLRKIRSMAGTDVKRILQIRRERAKRQQTRRKDLHHERVAADNKQLSLDDKCIAIGISTGGPPALSGIFQALEPPMPPIVVVQHMPESFTGPFAWRLDCISKLSIKEAASGDVLAMNSVYIAPGGRHLYLRRDGRQVKVLLRDGPPVSGHRPSVDVMMGCASEIYGNRCLGIVMTGMGRDGADGCKAVRTAGGFVLGQDEASSDVYGMNKVAFVEEGVDRQFSLDDAPTVIVRRMRRLWEKEPAAV